MPTVNQEADRIMKGMKKNHHRFKELYGKRDKEVMYATANKLAQKKQVKQKTWKSGDGFKEENKSGDSSLRDWFSKSRSSDGKPGWVQLGGKYAGKPCAKQPGQTTKPKCGSSKMKRNLNKDEEEAAFRRKNAKDPNPDRKGKAINVKTEETEVQEGIGDVAIKAIEKTNPPYLSKRSSMIRSIKKNQLNTYLKKRDKKKQERVANVGVGEKSTKNESMNNEIQMEGKGEKDACYKKVKSRYSVWPSAYASGALVKCRKVGAANWGNKSKKEEFEGNLSFSQFNEKAKACWDTHKKVGMKMKGGKLVNDCRPKNEEVTNEAKKCWKGYEKKGSQKLFGKTYNRCVKKEEVTNEGAAWTKKEGQNKSGGLNEKGRKSYERENPGSDLKAPSKKVGNKRRASFCARMKGMRKRQKPSNNTGDDRLSKSLRAWNC
jgi:hypothetical protein